MEIRSLEHIDFDTLFRGFESAFSDYEIRFYKDEVCSMLERRGYDPMMSFAAFDGGKIVAFTLNGVGHFNGIPTAYDTGTGTVKAYRGQGLAGKIFSHSIPFLKSAGIRQYLLEVLQNNDKAIAVYGRMAFRTTRVLDCFRQSVSDIRNLDTISDSFCRIMPIDIDSVRGAQLFCDFCPSWQNNFESIERGKSGLTFLGAFQASQMTGYCVFDSVTGDLSQIAVHNEFRRNGIGTQLLREATARMSADIIKVLNIPSDNDTLSRFLESKNIGIVSRQYEMLLPL